MAPQQKQFNQGSWKTLESAVQCASKNDFKGIVVTGTGGKDIGHMRISRGVVPQFFWKMVCYKDQGQTHVALFIGSNEPIATTEPDHRKRDTLTPRDQNDLVHIVGGSFASIWLSATKHAASDPIKMFASRYPNPVQCAGALQLGDTQKGRWMSQFSLLRTKRSVPSENHKPFCDKSQLDEFLKWKAALTKLVHGNGSDADTDDTDGSDEEQELLDTLSIPSKNCNKRIVGYYPSWGNTKVSLRTLSRFTHIIFAFFEMKADGNVLLGNPDHTSPKSSDEVKSIAEKRLNRLLSQAENLPELKITFALGGWENSQYFSAMAANQQSRERFYASVLHIIEEYGFDGVDIDWEYPVTGGATEGILADRDNFVTLLRELRSLLNARTSDSGKESYLLTFASAAGETALKVGYDLPKLLEYADWVNVMTYDYFGPWSSKWGAYTGPPAPLYHGVPKGYSGKFNVDWSIKQYVCKLKSARQVVMGVPLYGRYWHNVPAKSGTHSMFRLANEAGGKFDGGFVRWKDIKRDWLTNSAFQTHFDDKVKSPYAYNSNGTYLGYESPESIKHKIEFATNKNLGGLMVWAIDQDDDDLTMINMISGANLCTNDDSVKFKCVPIDDKRWWNWDDGPDMAGLCGKSAPLIRGYYPVCDPDDYGFSCCGKFGYCGSEAEFCDCATCVNYADNPDKILEQPIKPTAEKVTWHYSNAPDGQRSRCGREVPKVGDSFATCNADDANTHCCSKAGYCGTGDEFCNCLECVNFKNNPNYKYAPKTWWDVTDGEDKAGKCGPKAPLLNGNEPGCNPDSNYYCCSKYGSCGSGQEFCDCDGCRNYRQV